MSFQAEEIQLNLTYGVIACKWWGPKEKRPIITLHGWQDNAGSFDTLIPRLPSNLSYLAIDCPGHGLSSHLPKGCFYHMNDMVAILEEIRIKYSWQKLSLIGHSMGAIVSFTYSSLYPTRVDMVCAIDTLRAPPRLPLSLTMGHMEKLYVLESNRIDKSIKSFTYDEIKERWYLGSQKSVDRDKVDYLLKRGSKTCLEDPKKFQVSCDVRAKYMDPLVIEHEVSFHYIKRIKAAYMFIKSDDRNFAEPPQMLNEALNAFKMNTPHFRMMYVKGTHHVHLNNPELIAHEISDFVRMHYSEELPSTSKL